MSLGEILKEGFRITHHNWPLVLVQGAGLFLLFSVLFFTIFVPLLISGSASSLDDFQWEDLLYSDPEELISEWLLFFLFLIGPFLLLGITLSLVFYIFVSGGVRGIYKEELLFKKLPSPQTVSDFPNPGLRFSFSRFFKHGKNYFWRIAGLWALLGFLSLPLLIMGIVLFGGIAYLFEMEEWGEGIMALVLLGILLVPASLLFTLFSYFSNTFLVMEDKGPGISLRGGFQFLKSHFGPSLGIFLLLYLLIFFASSLFIGIQLPFSFIPLLGTFLSLFLLPFQIFLSIYLTLFMTATLMVFYQDRTKTERIDFRKTFDSGQ